MLAILNSLNAQNLPNFQPILIILVSKFMVHRALPDKTYSSLGLLSPLKTEKCVDCQSLMSSKRKRRCQTFGSRGKVWLNRGS